MITDPAPDCIGRVREKQLLGQAMASGQSEMIAISGRRRVGKTFLIRSFFRGKIDYEISGIHGASLREQLRNFSYQLADAAKQPAPASNPANWLEAFRLLAAFLESRRVKRKRVVFIDELPWLATPKSGFMQALEYFWNSWAVKQKIVVILCGSAASWMIRRLVHTKGGLHNRITQSIRLQPFDLEETRLFLHSRRVRLDPYQITQLYMVTGGIPLYLGAVQPGQSAAQAIDQLCFESQGLLVDEFPKLYASLFEHPEPHVRIVRALAGKRKGLTRKEITAAAQLQDGGSISRILDELESSGFITTYLPFGKRKREALHRLTDEYSLFYLQFMEGKKSGGKGTWLKLAPSQAWKSWSGYAFENICLKHLPQIKQALGISGVYVEASSFFHKGDGNNPGCQVDLVLDRKDHVVNLCEIKFHEATFTVSKQYAQELRDKVATFRQATKTRKQVALTLVTAFGLRHNEHSLGLVQEINGLEVLFRPS